MNALDLPWPLDESGAVIDLTADLVHGLVSKQFPKWSDLEVRPVVRQGWDNRTFRLGDELSVRLPSAEGYVAGISKEDHCLPILAGHLPLPVPEPLATGQPGDGYPFPWSVRRWLTGNTLDCMPDLDRNEVAHDLGTFLVSLRHVPTNQGPAAGRHSAFRGCHPSVYGDQVQTALTRLVDQVDIVACQRIWADALTTAWPAAPVWFHGDVAVDNLLADRGSLSAVIDFGTSGVGDPACDLVIAWTYFSGDERQTFRRAVDLPDAWRRARGWALWKALVTMADLSSPDPGGAQRRILSEVLADPISMNPA